LDVRVVGNFECRSMVMVKTIEMSCLLLILLVCSIFDMSFWVDASRCLCLLMLSWIVLWIVWIVIVRVLLL